MFSRKGLIDLGASVAAMVASAQHLGAVNYEVYPGSAFYLDQMLDRSSWSFVASHSNGLYHHPVGFQSLDNAQEETYSGHFTNRFAMVEGDMGSGSTTGDVANLQRMTALGLAPVAAFVNRPSTNLSTWRQLIRNNAAQGAPSYEMLAPHRLDDSPLGWYDPIRDYARANMLVPGCIGSGVDAPVYLYVHEGAAYRQTIYDLRDWSVANGRRFNYLLSPNNSYNAALLADTQFTVRDLEDKGHEPDVYGVVLYGERPVDLTPEKVNVNGVDQAATTITGLAYYLLKHRDGEAGTLDLSAFRSGTDHGAGITSATLANAGQTIALPTASSSTWEVRMANSSPWLDYAGVLRARGYGAVADWSIAFHAGATDVTSAVLSEDGRKFLGNERWMPGTTRNLTMTATPLTANPGAFKLVLEALPHGGVDHALDVLSFANSSHGNTPPTLALEARPRITREGLPLGPVWFTCGDAETESPALSVSAVSSNSALVPAGNLTFGQSGIQRWLRIVPASGQWGEAVIAVTVSDGSMTATSSFTLAVERTTVLPVVKADNVLNLESGPSWSGGSVPGVSDQAVWDSTVTSANATGLASPLTIAGLRIASPGGNVTIDGASPLTLGVSGVDLGSSTRDLFLNGQLLLDESATWNITTNRLARVSQGAGGPGGLTKSGNGRLELLGSDSFSGPLGVTAGELLKTGAGGQSSTTVSNNAVLRVSHSGAFGSGGLTISSANSSTGRVEVSGGISVLAGKPVTVNARTSNTDALVSVSGSNTFGGNVSLSTGGSLYGFSCAAGFLGLTGNLSSIATGIRNFTLRGAGNGSMSGTITDGSGVVGIIKSGGGTWRLEGTHGFTGDVAVQQGTLVVNQPLPQQAITVSSGALLTGSGDLGGPVTVAGSHSPGDGVGSQSVQGDLTYAAGSRIRWEIQIQSPTADHIGADVVSIGDGVMLDVTANGDGSAVDYRQAFWNEARQWPIIDAPGGLSGSPGLGSVSGDSGGRPAAPFGSFSIQSSASGVVLHWSPSSAYDRWLYEHFGDSWNDPLVAGPDRDPDGDGWRNDWEWIAGTIPDNAASRFTISVVPEGISFVRLEGRSYRVVTSATPTGPWSLHAIAPAGSGPIVIAHSQNPGPARFYRVVMNMDP